MSTQTAVKRKGPVRRGPVRRYLSDVWQGLYTTLVGMGVTGRWAFKKPVTELYPHEKYVPADGYRGVLFNKIEDCTGCMACARACPVDCIYIQTARRDPEDFSKASDGTPIKLWTTQFDIDMALCMECGLCTEVCPTLCLVTTKQFELASTTRKDLYLKFAVDAERAAEAAKRSAAKKAAEAAAAAAAADAEAASAAASKAETASAAAPKTAAASGDGGRPAAALKTAAASGDGGRPAAAQEENAQ